MMDKLSDIFNKTARKHPDNVAIVFHENESFFHQVTYKQLQDESMNVAGTISGGHGFLVDISDVASDESNYDTFARKTVSSSDINNKPHPSVIAILCHPGPAAIACILGVLKYNAYFYINPDCSKVELMTCVNRVKPKFILVEEDVSVNVDLDFTVISAFAVFDKKFKLILLKEFQNHVLDYENRDLAYAITTSGSTGIPKFVYVPHRCIIPNIYDFVKIFRIGIEDAIFCAAPLTFDPSVVDLFMAFKTGAKLVMVAPQVLKIPDVFLDIMIKEKVTILQATPALVFSIKAKVKETILSKELGLKVLALGGESFPKLSVLKNWLGKNCKTRIFNIYGITEVSCWATVEEVNVDECVHCIKNDLATNNQTKNNENVLDDMVPIGKPLSSTIIKVLKSDCEEAAEGEQGEIFVGGTERVCWIDDGSLCALEFMNVKGNDSKQVLRQTGDKGVLKNGSIYCVGRLDFIVKRNGQKISLHEITRACETFSYIEKCMTIQEGKKIIAFVCTSNENVISEETVKKDLKSLLSYWKMPDEIIIVKEIPFNEHGKVSKEKLLEERQIGITCNITNSDSLEYLLKTHWTTVLGINTVHYKDNFVKCGGDSLSAIHLAEELEKHLTYEVPELLDVILNSNFENTLELLTRCYHAENKKTFYPRKRLRKAYLKNESQSGQQSGISEREIVLNIKTKEIQADSVTQKCVVSRRGFFKYGNFEVDLLLPQHAELSWKYNLGKCIDSSPIIVEYNNDKMYLFVGSHSHKFICADALTGGEYWSVTLADRIESSPSVSQDGRFVYVGCYSGDLFCISIDDGHIFWKYKTGDVIKSSPVVDYSTGNVIFGSHDKNLYCLNKKGKLVWKNEISEGSIFSSPCVCDNLVCVGTLDGVIAGVDINSGVNLWRDHVGKPVFSSPAKYSEGIVFGNVIGDIFGYSFTGCRLWKYEVGSNIFSSPFVLKLLSGEEVIAIGCHNNNVYFLNSKGEKKLVYCCKSPVYATPFLYIANNNYVISVICETSGLVNIVSLNAENSTCKPVLHSIGKTSLTPSTVTEVKIPGELFASPVVHRNKVYICSRDNFIYSFDLKPT
ncbi:beta-alanine-activating enzyme-like isoform X1 [Penaeus chinensis]|uniref:beta-alanine-activating enzyme-like isoform X1 n=1 Tax=Penaeus chinensis TaxID=139456 RepID=UPI001FB67846|nr:beta-alanine-activating enzyme-like isoform X1 [Penaeus chinensis]